MKRRKEEHLKPLIQSKVQSHQPRGPNKGLALRDHNREDRKNRVRVPLVRGLNQVSVPLDRGQGKVRDHQAKGLNRASPLQAKDLQVNRHQNQVKHHQVKVPSRVALPSKKVHHHHKDLRSLDLSSKGHIQESRQRAGPL